MVVRGARCLAGLCLADTAARSVSDHWLSVINISNHQTISPLPGFVRASRLRTLLRKGNLFASLTRPFASTHEGLILRQALLR
jgi:hypothetical protein